MSHLARWCALSLALHLAAGTGLVLLLPDQSGRTPQAIMVELDGSVAPETAPRQEVRAPARAGLGPAAPAASGRALPAVVPPEAARRDQGPQGAPAAKGPLPDGLVTGSPAPEQKSPEHSQSGEGPKPEAGTAIGAQSRPEIAGAAANPVPQPAAPGTPVPEQAQQRYLREQFAYISSLIARRLVYPPLARRMNWSGKVVLAFDILEDGSVHKIRVAQSSGFPILDKSALETVKRASPFPKPPVRAEIVVPITFRIVP